MDSRVFIYSLFSFHLLLIRILTVTINHPSTPFDKLRVTAFYLGVTGCYRIPSVYLLPIIISSVADQDTDCHPELVEGLSLPKYGRRVGGCHPELVEGLSLPKYGRRVSKG